MKGLGQRPYARVLIFLILSFCIVFLVNKNRPTSLCLRPSSVAHQGEGGISYMWLGLDGRPGDGGGEAVGRSSLMRTKRTMAVKWGERKRAREDCTPSQMIPREMKTGGQTASLTRVLSALYVP